jgi:hypothetical protein
MLQRLLPLALMELPHPLLQLLLAPLLVQLVRTPPQLHLTRTAELLLSLCMPPLTHLFRPVPARLFRRGGIEHHHGVR